jgi:succinoglycan biosynthesis protein ExoO
LEAAKGKWIAILDGDDQWLPHRLEKMVQAAIEAGDSYFLADDLVLCFDTPSGLRSWKRQFGEYQIRLTDGALDLNLLEFIKTGAPVIKPVIPMEHINKHSLRFESTCLCGEDLEFWAHLFRTGLRLRLIPDALYCYRITPGSLTSKSNRYEHLIKVYERLLKYEEFSYEERTLFEIQIEKIKKEQKWDAFTYMLKKGSINKSLSLMLQNPGLFFEFLKRLPKSLNYRLSALCSRGKVR